MFFSSERYDRVSEQLGNVTWTPETVALILILAFVIVFTLWSVRFAWRISKDGAYQEPVMMKIGVRPMAMLMWVIFALVKLSGGKENRGGGYVKYEDSVV